MKKFAHQHISTVSWMTLSAVVLSACSVADLEKSSQTEEASDGSLAAAEGGSRNDSDLNADSICSKIDRLPGSFSCNGGKEPNELVLTSASGQTKTQIQTELFVKIADSVNRRGKFSQGAVGIFTVTVSAVPPRKSVAALRQESKTDSDKWVFAGATASVSEGVPIGGLSPEETLVAVKQWFQENVVRAGAKLHERITGFTERVVLGGKEMVVSVWRFQIDVFGRYINAFGEFYGTW